MARTLLLCVAAIRTAAAVSAKCGALGPTDVVVFIDLQNCFMEQRPYAGEGAPRYAVAASDLDSDGINIPDGPLRTVDSKSIIPVANDWIARADSAGSPVIFTLDWHPADHCSFCNIQAGGVAAPFFCYSGSVIVHAYNESMRCTDPVSERDWAFQQYYQWASHCVAGSFGARLDPFLQAPADATYVKLGVETRADSYSGFDSGRISTSTGAHDVIAGGGADSLADLAPTSQDLRTTIEGFGGRRLFLMGLATDYVVKNTMLDAIGANDGMPETYEPSGAQCTEMPSAFSARGTPPRSSTESTSLPRACYTQVRAQPPARRGGAGHPRRRWHARHLPAALPARQGAV